MQPLTNSSSPKTLNPSPHSKPQPKWTPPHLIHSPPTNLFKPKAFSSDKVEGWLAYFRWVPIKNNDWYWIRHHIKVGILAKQDPYRSRFPIQLRFVYPNIDHLIFNRFDFPPIFHHDEDTNPDELRRDCGRPPVPRKDRSKR